MAGLDPVHSRRTESSCAGSTRASIAQTNPMTGERAHSSEGTRLVWNLYPAKVRLALLAKQWNGEDKAVNEHPDLIYIAGNEVRALLRPCAAGEM